MAENPMEVPTELNPDIAGLQTTLNGKRVVIPATIMPTSKFFSNANGINFVPYDGYLSVLHKGERVMPASQNKNYTYNNHTYFGSVNLHNGLEVDALTESIERNNRRKRNGYGAN